MALHMYDMDDLEILDFLRDSEGARPIDVAWHLSFMEKDVCFATVALHLLKMEHEGKVTFNAKDGRYHVPHAMIDHI